MNLSINDDGPFLGGRGSESDVFHLRLRLQENIEKLVPAPALTPTPCSMDTRSMNTFSVDSFFYSHCIDFKILPKNIINYRDLRLHTFVSSERFQFPCPDNCTRKEVSVI